MSSRTATLLEQEMHRRPDEQIACRAMRHAWSAHSERYTRTETLVPGREVMVLEISCERGCGVVRIDTFLVEKIRGGAFRVIENRGSHRRYPADYTIPLTDGEVSAQRRSSAVWSEHITRQIGRPR